MADAFADFLEPPRHPRSKAARVSSTNPKSQNPDDPYCDLDAEDIPPFKVIDSTSAVFDHPEEFEIHEVSYNTRREIYNGYGYRILRSGARSAKPVNQAVEIHPCAVPSRVKEVLFP